MSEQSVKYRDLRIFFAIGATVLLALFFWLSSRYPALNQKAMMGGDTPVSGLSFDILIEIFPDSSVWWEIVANTANWIYTNLKGMTFGVLFGAAALTLLSLIKKRSFDNGFANAALGTVIGAPLGVCVNCAAPIALGLHMGRMRLETTLAALLASPTLNVIVITMSFALLPIHLAVIKLMLALVMVLLVVPLMCRYILKSETEATRGNVAKVVKIAEPKGLVQWIAKVLTPMDAPAGDHGLLASAVWFVKSYARNFFFVFLITVPMMLLAAVLGALVATFVAPNELIWIFPNNSAVLVLFAMLLTALVASFVPAPIALDVILTTILINIGLRADYAMVALIGLGSFSIYAFIIIARAISLRTAAMLWIAVIGMAMIGGILANKVHPFVTKYYVAQQRATLDAVDHIDWPTPKPLAPGKTIAELRPVLDAQALQATPLAVLAVSDQGSSISVQQLEIRARTAPKRPEGKTNFTRVIGTDIGLAEEGVNSPIREIGYHMMVGGIAAGDIHGDGWTDIVTRRPDHAMGLSVYANIGGRFERQEANLGPVDDLEVFNVALADVDGDGRLDLTVSTIFGGAFVFFNQDGSFTADAMQKLETNPASVAPSISFADMDLDGDLDILLGNWGPRGVAEGWRIKPVHIRNIVQWNDGQRRFRAEIIPGIPGQTLTAMIADFNHDGVPDYFNGDDASSTDMVTFFGPDEKFLPSPRDSQPFLYHTGSTMSYDQGDWNNDLIDDYYGAQIAMAVGNNARSRAHNRTLLELCQQFAADIGWTETEVRQCAAELLSIDSIRNGKSGKGLDSCQRPSRTRDRAICAAQAVVARMEIGKRNPEGDRPKFERCQRRLAHIPEIQRLCGSLLLPAVDGVSRATLKKTHRPTLPGRNILYTGRADGQFDDLAEAMNVKSPGWSWNSRFVDLDQDGWQDLLVATSIWMNAASSTTNVFYHNQAGRGFTDDTASFGFTDILPTYSYVTLDYDMDGDVDVIRDNSALRMIVHRNDRPAGQGLWVTLQDGKGNTHAIGARVTVCFDGARRVEVGRCQMRQIRASGGYMSSDPIVAQFGMGKAKSVSLIDIQWPDGEKTSIAMDRANDGTSSSFSGGSLKIVRD